MLPADGGTDGSEDSDEYRVVREDLLLLLRYSRHRDLGFSAEGFFIVDFSLLFAMITTTVVYVILLLQFPIT